MEPGPSYLDYGGTDSEGPGTYDSGRKTGLF